MDEELNKVIQESIDKMEEYKQRIIDNQNQEIAQAKYNHDVTDINDEVSKNNTACAELVEGVRNKFTSDSTNLKEKYDQDVEELTKKFEADKNSLLKEYEENIVNLTSDRDSKIKDLESARDAKNNKYRNSVYSQVEVEIMSKNSKKIKNIENKITCFKNELES